MKIGLGAYLSVIFAMISGLSILSPANVFAQTAPHGTGGAECINGLAAGFQCSNVNLLSIVTPEEMGASETCNSKLPSKRCLMSDMWGWADPVTGKEYAIVGREDGTSFIDVTDPSNPIYIGNLQHNGSKPSYWRDMKVYKDHVFIVADRSAGNGIQILDLTLLRGFSGTPITFQMSAHYSGFTQAHNIVVNEETGFAYVVGASGGTGCQGLYMLEISNPLVPQFSGCHMEPAPSHSYTHDAQCVVYRGPDADYSGHEICLLANENFVVIVDVTDKSHVKSVSRIVHPSFQYVHQGWLTEDQAVFIQNDEEDERNNTVSSTRTIFWDVKDLDDPVELTVFDASGTSIDHNLYVKGDLVFQSNYTDGLHILNISDPAQPFEVGFFDTHKRTAGMPGYDPFDGTWSNYPYFRSGAIAVSSFEEGLLMVRLTGSSPVHTEPTEIPESVAVTDAYPNPFRDHLTVTLEVPTAQRVNLTVFDVLGRPVRSVALQSVHVNRAHTFEINLSGLPAGTYYYRIQGETFDISKPVTRIE